MEAEWNKTRKSAHEEELAYQVAVGAEDAAQAGDPLSFDINDAHGCQAALQGSGHLGTVMPAHS